MFSKWAVCDVRKPWTGTRFIQTQDNPVDLNMKYENMFVDVFSESVQLTYRILNIVPSFGEVTKKNVHSLLKEY